MKKKSKFDIIKDHIIICNECKVDNKRNSQELEKILLEQTIEDLTFEVEAKGKQLERVIIDKDTTLQEAIRTEEDLIQIIQEREKTLNEQVTKIRELEDIIRSLKKDKITRETQTVNYNRIAYTQTVKNIKTTETQTQQCKHKDITSQTDTNTCKVDTQTCQFSLYHATAQAVPAAKSHVEAEQQPKKCSNIKKLLFLCDQTGKYIHRHLLKNKNLTGFQIQTVIKPEAQLISVIENMDKLVKDFSHEDYVVVLAGTNDFDNKRYPRVKPLADKIKKCLHTNMIFMTTPVNYHNHPNKLRIIKFNLKLKEFTQKVGHKVPLNVSVVDVNTKKGLKQKDYVLADDLSREVLRNKTLSKSLIFIDLKENAERSSINEKYTEVPRSIIYQEKTNISLGSESGDTDTNLNSSLIVCPLLDEISDSSSSTQNSSLNTALNGESARENQLQNDFFLYPRLSQITLD